VLSIQRERSEMDLTILAETGLFVEVIPERLFWSSRSNTPMDSESIHFFNTVSQLFVIV
jgi:hypothetical protein